MDKQHSPLELKATYAELSKSTGIPEDTVARILDELGLKEVRQQAVCSAKTLSLPKLRIAFRAAAVAQCM